MYGGYCVLIKMLKYYLEREWMCKNVYIKRILYDGLYDIIILVGSKGGGYIEKIYEFLKYCFVLFYYKYIKGCIFLKFMM